MKGSGRPLGIGESIRKLGGPPLRQKFELFSSPQKEDDSEYRALLDKYKMKFEEKWKQNKEPASSGDLKDFETIRTLGCGSFGRVLLAKHKSTGKFWALKVLDKGRIVRLKQIEHTLYERRILLSINFPFTINMDSSFKDNSYLYFVLPFINGGEMFSYLRKKHKFEEHVAKFYAAQVVLGLEYLHHLDLVYRDLKPENILIDSEGFLKITDLGFCKLVKGRTWTLCGTPEYIAPEIILSRGYGTSVDWWSFGILIYEMTAGYTPFYAEEPMRLYEKIVTGRFKYGNLRGGTSDIKNHKWFKNTNWMNVHSKKIESPYVPRLKGPGDASNFDMFDEEPLKYASGDIYAKEFAEF